MFATIPFFCLMLSCAHANNELRMKRRTGDQAPEGQCQMFKWGGTSGWHWYNCCNNCNSRDTSCDGKTWHSASSESYCSNCGVDNNKGNGKKNDNSFHCGGCSGQNTIQQRCSSGIRRFYRIPGFCWAFAKCFKKKCSNSGFSLQVDSSFDLVCNNGETIESNPTDCCGKINAECDWKKYDGTNQCPPECCSEPTCCKSSGSLTITGLTVLTVACFATSMVIVF